MKKTTTSQTTEPSLRPSRVCADFFAHSFPGRSQRGNASPELLSTIGLPSQIDAFSRLHARRSLRSLNSVAASSTLLRIRPTEAACSTTYRRGRLEVAGRRWRLEGRLHWQFDRPKHSLVFPAGLIRTMGMPVFRARRQGFQIRTGKIGIGIQKLASNFAFGCLNK